MHKLLHQWCLYLDVQLKTPLKSSFPMGLFNQTLSLVYLYFVLYLIVQGVEKGSKETLED